ncbi:uncharacterized protein PITG_06681 [Phytophthora infestans T30-4]|uniref:Uncharacterized protein n=1 Tax=Phytophthora infestans (strain T30-4) TaxID=403677 RepID=D0N5F5_PHYIT|nr:uncharacterized protein PITG_06681 [Phytophthora infestans T30-4]EEY70113.1 hypothetical protein PITG_06681 [Phytophthora infestans T30-4]|eukprot:XP_002998760.1 hypothetical protein PITG_06681 [Phytophthora infestans T30-4]
MPALLTTHGVQQLYQDETVEAVIRLQVLGVYRYLADPALKKRLGQHFADAHDVFDVLLSDGHHKMKTVLAPKCHKLVWTRELTARSLIRLNFISTTDLREVELLPLVGERLYYMPLRSDHYTLDWACSFTGGIPDEDSPLDELERNWSSRYGAVASTTSSVAWNMVPDYCANLFTPEWNKLHTILEVLDKIKKHSTSNPPMIGAVRVKSKVLHLGDPSISNPFPFAFNAVVGNGCYGCF